MIKTEKLAPGIVISEKLSPNPAKRFYIMIGDKVILDALKTDVTFSIHLLNFRVACFVDEFGDIDLQIGKRIVIHFLSRCDLPL